MLTKQQFDVLAMIAQAGTVEQIAADTGLTLDEVQTVLQELSAAGWVQDQHITDKGNAMLAPYQVKRAVIIAAGFGSRLVPITLNTPKPLVRVDGVRIIDRLIKALLAADITEIYVVRGYLGTQFDDLLYQFPQIKFIENPRYNESNNISSVLAAKDYLAGAYIM